MFEVAAADGVHYLAMEYVHGCDLRELLGAAQKAKAALPYEAAVAIVMAAAAGLDHAHRRCGPDGRPLHLVHRDVSLSRTDVFALGESDVWEDDAPTRGRRSHSRMWSPLAA